MKPAIVEPPQPTAEEVAKTEKETKATLLAMGDDFVKQLADEVAPPKPPEKKDDPKPGEPVKPAAAAPKPGKKPVKVAPRVAPAAEAVDYERLATATGRAVAEALKPKEEVKPVEAKTYLTPDDVEQISILERMAVNHPDKYKGIVEKYETERKAVHEYQEKWEAENEGKTFDPDDDEHKDFYAKHALDWSDADEFNAKVDIATDKRIAEVERKHGSKLTEIEQKQRAMELQPQVFAEAKYAGKQVFELLGGDYKTLLNKNGTTNRDQLNKIYKDDPESGAILSEVSRIENLAAESFRLFNGAVNFDKNNAKHIELSDFAAAQDEAILALPAEDQLDKQGRKFAKSVDFYAMDDKKREKHYTLSARDISNLLAQDLGMKLKKKLESERAVFEQKASQYGYSKGDGTAAKPAGVQTSKPTPVSSTSEPISGGETRTRAGVGENSKTAFVDQMLNG